MFNFRELFICHFSNCDFLLLSWYHGARSSVSLAFSATQHDSSSSLVHIHRWYTSDGDTQPDPTCASPNTCWSFQLRQAVACRHEVTHYSSKSDTNFWRSLLTEFGACANVPTGCFLAAGAPHRVYQTGSVAGNGGADRHGYFVWVIVEVRTKTTAMNNWKG